MRRLYSDLHLCPDLKDSKQAASMVNKAVELGYRLVAMTFPPACSEEQLRQTRDVLSEAKIDLATRVDLRAKTPNDLMRSVRKLRRRFEIVCVVLDSKSVSRQAAKDRRVDLLNFSGIDFRSRFFDLAEAQLASNSLASLEIDMRPLLTLEGPARIRLLSSLRREAEIATSFHVPIVVSSGVSSALLMRRPRELASLALLFDLDKASALKAVSENPTAIVRRNREKLDSKFVAPGIRVIRRGKDC